MKKFVLRAGVSLCVLFMTAAVFAQPTASIFRMRDNYITGLTSPVLLTHAGDGTRRIFIVQQGGIIKVVQPGSTTPTDFMNITTKVVSGGERGLLGLAFHPNFETNGYFFVNYTRSGDGATIIARYKAINNNTIGDPNSERIILGPIAQPFSNHNGGGIAFREDAPGVYNLYIGMGDGGSGNDPGNRAQNINELLGKFLRITPDVSGSPTAPPYTVPQDNPYVGIPGADEIFAIGLRNPWRWSFDRGGTHELWAGDVGQGAREEVDIINLGGNYGWRVYEGTLCTNIDPGLCNPANYTMPVFDYSSATGTSRCAVTGGYVYRGNQNALPRGLYIYADYCSGEILKWQNNSQILMRDTARSISSFGEDEDGELYVVGLGGTIDKILGNKTSADFNGDLYTDFTVWRPSNGVWYSYYPIGNTVTYTHFGVQGDIPTPEDYDGDFKTDVAVFRPPTGTWYVMRSSDSTFQIAQFGQPGDIPSASDYTGDGKADFTVFRPSEGAWYILRSEGDGYSAFPFGMNGDVPVPGDYDGDGRTDVAVWRPSNGAWYSINTTDGGTPAYVFGLQGDIPTPGDFDGDGKQDRAVFRPSTGVWYIARSSDNGVTIVNWGLNSDIPVVGDYDLDFKDDVAVFRPPTGVWYYLRSTNGSFGALQFGQAGDLPAPAYDLP